MSTPAPGEPPSGQIPYGYGYPAPGYPPQPYGYGGVPPGYGVRQPRNGLAITSMVLGIIGVATCWLTFPGIIFGILAMIFGGVGLARARTDRVSNKGMAIAGLVTGVLAVVIGSVLLYFTLRVASDCIDQYGQNPTDQELAQCVEDQLT